MKRIITYLRPLIEGNDHRISIKRVLALAFAIDAILNTNHAIHKWAVNRSMSDAAMLLGLEYGMIASLLTLTSYFNFKERKLSADNQTEPKTE